MEIYEYFLDLLCYYQRQFIFKDKRFCIYFNLHIYK